MRKKIIILLALTVFITTSTCFAADSGVPGGIVALEKADFSDAVVTATLLNVREGPSTSYPAIGKLENGQEIMVIGKLGDWYAIYDLKDGLVGAVDGRYIKTSGTAVPASAADITVKAVPDISDDEQALLDLVNNARKDAGVPELAFDGNLVKTARLKAEDMVENNYFSHQSPTYGSPWDMMKQFDSSFKTAGENIAGNQTVEGAFKAWMANDTHKKNILNGNFNYTGIGIVSSETYGKIVVVQFIGS